MRRLSPAIVLLALPLIFGGCGGGANPYQGLGADALYETARDLYDGQQFDKATEALDRLLIAYGDWGRIAEARLLLAHAHFANKDFLTSRTEYLRFVDRYPTDVDAPVAALGVCKSLSALSPHPQRDQSFTSDATTVCRNVVIDYAGTAASVEAADITNEMRRKMAEKEFLGAEFYFRRKLYDSAILYYQSVRTSFPETEFAPQALLGMYLANKAIGYEDEAEANRQTLLTDYPDSPAATQVKANGVGG